MAAGVTLVTIQAGDSEGTVVYSGTLNFLGPLTLGAVLQAAAIPTADPHVAGEVWSNSGVLTVSAG